jgi:hypothetical protein
MFPVPQQAIIRVWPLALWLVLTGVGATLIALPDTDDRLITFSGEHGPSLLDSIGAIVLLIAFGLLLAGILRGRAAIAERLRSRPPQLAGLAFLGGLGLGMLIAGVFTDFWWWWLVGAGLMQMLWFALWRLAHQSSFA